MTALMMSPPSLNLHNSRPSLWCSFSVDQQFRIDCHLFNLCFAKLLAWKVLMSTQWSVSRIPWASCCRAFLPVAQSSDRLWQLILGSPDCFLSSEGIWRRPVTIRIYFRNGFRFLRDPNLPSQTCCQSDAGESFYFLTDGSKQSFHNFSSIFLQLRKFVWFNSHFIRYNLNQPS